MSAPLQIQYLQSKKPFRLSRQQSDYEQYLATPVVAASQGGGVRNLQAFFDFHRSLQLSIAGAFDDHDPELAEILLSADQHLKDLVEDQRFIGVLLITDFGEPVHKKLMGINTRH